MEHNEEHATEFDRWAEAAERIRLAARQMEQADVTLQLTLDELGRPVSLETHQHTH